MFIDINTLGPEGLAFDHHLRLRDLQGPSGEALGEVEAHLVGSVVPGEVGTANLTARLEAPLELQCGRCLERFRWVSDSRFDLEIVPAAADGPSTEAESPATPESRFPAADGKILLEPMATEQIYLNFPLKPICRPDCRGLCPTCGANRNTEACACTDASVDPRLAPLLAFRQKKNQES